MKSKYRRLGAYIVKECLMKSWSLYKIHNHLTCHGFKRGITLHQYGKRIQNRFITTKYKRSSRDVIYVKWYLHQNVPYIRSVYIITKELSRMYDTVDDSIIFDNEQQYWIRDVSLNGKFKGLWIRYFDENLQEINSNVCLGPRYRYQSRDVYPASVIIGTGQQQLIQEYWYNNNRIDMPEDYNRYPRHHKEFIWNLMSK